MWAACKAVSCRLSENAMTFCSFSGRVMSIFETKMSVAVDLPTVPKEKSLLNSLRVLRSYDTPQPSLGQNRNGISMRVTRSFSGHRQISPSSPSTVSLLQSGQ